MADQEEKVEPEETPEETPQETAEESAEAEAQASPEAESESEPEAAAESPEAGAAEAPEATPEAPAEDEVPAEPQAEDEAEAEAPAEEYTYEVLHKMTVASLRDIAQGIEHDALQGYSTMHKEHLVPALCEALGIEAHVHHEVVGINKDRVKAKIRALKVERQKALEAGDKEQLKLARRRIKSLKRKIRRATV